MKLTNCETATRSVFAAKGYADFLIFKRVVDSGDNTTEQPPETISKEDFAVFATTSAQQLADIKNDIKSLAERVKTILD